jgi:hypothetical protein
VWCGAGLSYDTNETALKDAFSHHGDVLQGPPVPSPPTRFNWDWDWDSSMCCLFVTTAKVICHPTTGKSKGYGLLQQPSFSTKSTGNVLPHATRAEANQKRFSFTIAAMDGSCCLWFSLSLF